MEELKATRLLAVVTGASSGIGYNLAKLAAERGYDLVVAADTPLEVAVMDFESLGAQVTAVHADLATPEGVQELIAAIGERQVDALLANAGHGLGGAFLEQDFHDILHVVNTNITGTLHLVQHVARRMVQRVKGVGAGRILITGSIAGFQPGSFQAVYNGTKAFIDSFALALRNELNNTRVTISLLMPGVTDTEFFVRADMLDTKVNTGPKADPYEVAKIGFDAMLKGEADVVAGFKNRLELALSKMLPAQAVAEMQRWQVAPGTGKME
ncbi:MAG: dehydrogenase/reductase oxidoreductase protein-like protein [Ramlibacter sp.]|nr:dehydrogenase/reductase oxidoreductase protein-like protein [Ramlibacter sp.]